MSRSDRPRPDEHAALGQLRVDVYASLPGFPTPQQQPAYYEMLAGIGRFAERAGAQVVLHTTRAMATAWRMYERLGFVRHEELDFLQQELPVFGLRTLL